MVAALAGGKQRERAASERGKEQRQQRERPKGAPGKQLQHVESRGRWGDQSEHSTAAHVDLTAGMVDRLAAETLL
jgi:hypothetical protein